MTANPLTPIPPIGPTTAIGQPLPASRFKPLDPLKVLRQYARILIATAVVGVLLGVLTWYLLLTNIPKYESEAQLLVVDTRPIIGRDADVTGGSEITTAGEPLIAYMRTQVFRIKSEEVISNVIKRQDVRDTDWYRSFGGDAQKAREDLQETLKANPITGTQLIGLSMRTTVPRDAQVILDAVISVFLDVLNVEAVTRGTEVRRHLLLARERLDEDLRMLDQQMLNFRTRNDLPSLTANQNEATVEYALLSEEEAKMRLALDNARATFSVLQEARNSGQILEPSPADLREAERDQAVFLRDERLRNLREEREVMVGRFGEHHRAVKDIDDRIQATERERKRELERLLAAQQEVRFDTARKNVQSIEAAVASLKEKLDAARARMTDLTNKLAEYKQLEEQMLRTKDRKDRVDETIYLKAANDEAGIVRVRRQTNPDSPDLVFPRLSVVVPGVTILILGAVTGLVFLVEMLDQRLKSPSDVKMLPNAELLGVLPDGGEDPSGTVPIESVVKHYPTGLMAESFRHVRTALLTRMDRRGYKTLVVVGPKPGCGTSAILGNLALSLAYNGRKVLVIDANFRRPSQHQLFDVPRDPGLVDVLQASLPIEQAIRHVSDPAMDILPAGTAEDAPPELLEGSPFRRMLTMFESQYDMVLIDAPPALLASESQLLAKHVDALALVVRAMSDKRGMVERMLRILDGQRADVLGIILNGVRSTAGGYLRQSYQEFYRYRSGASSKAAYGVRRSTPITDTAPATNGNGHDEPHGNGKGASDRITAEAEVQAQLDGDDDDTLARRD